MLVDTGLKPHQIAQRLQIDMETVDRFLNQSNPRISQDEVSVPTLKIGEEGG